MSIIAEFTVPADEFALYQTLCEIPEMVVEVERVVAHDEGHLVPYFWVSGESYAEFEQRAKDDPSYSAAQTLPINLTDHVSRGHSD